MRTRRVIALATFLVASGGAFAVSARTAEPTREFDSGRYGVEASCEPGSSPFLECGVTIRDLVYETVLVRNQKLSVTPGGALGGSLAFEGKAATGPKQTLTVALDPATDAATAAASPRARFVVEVREGEHVVQRYSFVVPVAAE